MVADFVGNNVGLGKISRRAEAGGKVMEKGQVEIDFFVPRTIERPDCGTCKATG